MAEAHKEGAFYGGTEYNKRIVRCEKDAHGVGIRGSESTPGGKLPRTALLPEKEGCTRLRPGAGDQEEKSLLDFERTSDRTFDFHEAPSRSLVLDCLWLSLNHAIMWNRWNADRMRGIWWNWMLIVYVRPSAM